ncbi:hypothetical protein AMK16_00195 [Streptomyces sp. CB00455]|uniref:hypothetical protein n=1 Tax=Streptomyces sp. CB00455 TaxID=1703927 RepID=UPI000938DF57|nr:hypothetical protein [Streptomyces sp. CB00455]OKK21767.1 hypothetical protein AMK16_00195 [Streptomyces sp. CB00455]
MNRLISRGLGRASLALGAALVSTVLCTTVSAAAPGGVSGVAGMDSLAPAVDARACPVVYFDLGETLVHTADDGSIAYQSGAAAYLRALRERHIRVGLITNVPPSWGTTDAERAARLKKEVDATWKGSVPFAWKDFGDRILTPRTEAERKPAPVLWQRARAESGHCRLVFQAETAEEVQIAASLGYVPYQVGQPHRPAFLPVGLVQLLGHGSEVQGPPTPPGPAGLAVG